MKKSVLLCSAAVVLLTAAAAASRFAVLPALDQVPGNLNATVRYTGSADLLNAQAISTGDVAHVVLPGVRVSGSRQVRATATTGTAVLLDDHTLVTGPGGKTIADTDHRWSVDRKDLSALQGPAQWQADSHQGLVAGFPLHPAAHDYPFWDTGTNTATTAHYTRTTTNAGHRAYVFTISVSGPVANAKLTAALPPALPKTLVAGIAQTLPTAGRTAIQATVAGTSGPVVPLSYVSVSTATAWVDAGTGVVLDQQARQAVLAEVATGSGPQELLPVADLHLTMTAASTQAAVSRADTAATARTWLGAAGPGILLGLAVALGGLAGWLGRRRPASAGEAVPAEEVAAEPAEQP